MIWRDGERGQGGQFGAQVAFSPDSNYLSSRWRPAAHDAGPGSQPAAGQDSAPDAGWQTCPGNPMAGKTGAAERARDRPAFGYRSREDGPGGKNLHLPRTKPDAGGDLEHRDIVRPMVWLSRRMDGCGRWSMARAAAMS